MPTQKAGALCPDTLCEEIVKLSHAEGVPLPDNFPEQTMEFAVNSVPASHRPSMYYDLIDGKRLELESLNGTVVLLARKHGISTPINFAIYAALKPYVDGAPALP